MAAKDWQDAGGGGSESRGSKMTAAEAIWFGQVQSFAQELGTVSAQLGADASALRDSLSNSTSAPVAEIGYKNANSAASTSAMFDSTSPATVAASAAVVVKRIGTDLERILNRFIELTAAVDKFSQSMAKQPLSELLGADSDGITALALTGGLTPPAARVAKDETASK